MEVRRATVIGCGGAGKTVVSRVLAARYDLPVIHADAHVRGDDGEFLSEPEWFARYRALIAAERWVFDGMKPRLLPERLAVCDLVVFLDLPTHQCLWGVLVRRLRHRGVDAPELGVYDKINLAFIRWIIGFRRETRPRVLELLRDAKCEVVVLKSRRQVRRYLRDIAAV